MKPHKHKFVRAGLTGPNWSIRCERCDCGEERQVPSSKKERDDSKRGLKRSIYVHHLWHPIIEALDPRPADGYEGKVGWEAMKWMERYAKRHPEIVYCHCDDSCFSNSAVWLVPHFSDGKLGREWMGVSALYIPQCTDERPISFFLYPGDDHGLVVGLRKMIKFRRRMRG